MRENIYKTVYLTRDLFSKELLQLNNKKANANHVEIPLHIH